MKAKELTTIRIITTLALLLFLVQSVSATPPHPDRKAELGVQAIEVYLQAKARSPELDAPGPLGQPTGTYKAIVLLVDFTDNLGVVNESDFEDLLFSVGTYPIGSMRDYYKEVSYNQFEVDGVINGTIGTPPNWFPMPQTYAYYVNSNYGWGTYPQNAQKLAEDAVIAANPHVDYTQYDNDGDGKVDSLFIVHAGSGAEWTGNVNDIWSHKWQMAVPPVLDGMTFDAYSMEPEFWNAPGDMTVGVFCHEYGHVLGLPDLYDLSGAGEGIGDWGLMGTGMWNGPMGSRPAHPCAWSKVEWDWVTPTVILTNQIGMSIPNVETNQSIFRLWTDGMAGNEYFLVENRLKILFDDGLPGECLLIYHVDDSVPQQNNPAHYKVDVEQADGNFDLNNGTNRGDAGDPWPGTSGKTTFDKDSTPNSRDYSGNDTLVAVKNISDCGPTMTADLYVAPPLIEVALDIKPTSCPNPLNVKSNGILPVAVLGTEDFDVRDISWLMLEGVPPVSFNYEDIGTPFNGEPCDCHEAVPDGYLDLTMKFHTQEIVTALGFVEDGNILELNIIGEDSDGNPIVGSDCISVIKKGKK